MKMTSYVYEDSFVCQQAVNQSSWFCQPDVCLNFRLSTNWIQKRKLVVEAVRTHFVTILSPDCVFFSVLAHINFAVGRLKRGAVRARVVNASIDIGDWASFPSSRSNTSSSA